MEYFIYIFNFRDYCLHFIHWWFFCNFLFKLNVKKGCIYDNILPLDLWLFFYPWFLNKLCIFIIVYSQLTVYIYIYYSSSNIVTRKKLVYMLHSTFKNKWILRIKHYLSPLFFLLFFSVYIRLTEPPWAIRNSGVTRPTQNP